MTQELTLDSELNRQLKAVRNGQSNVIVCPWCGVFNAESESCCEEFRSARERISVENLERLLRQFAEIRKGRPRDSVECPYCGQINRKDNMESPAHWKRPGVNPWCCDLMVMAVMRIGESFMEQDRIDKFRRIQDKVGAN